MIILLSPSKTMDLETKIPTTIFSNPIFAEEAKYIGSICTDLSKEDIMKLMSVSEKLAELNYERFKSFGKEGNIKRQAIYTYDGDVYDGLGRDKYKKEDLDFAQNSLRVISGLYGILRPLDLIEPYRLEMGIKLSNKEGSDLYSYWKNRVTSKLIEELKTHNAEFIINLASNEYSNILDRSKLENKIIDITFKENKEGKLKIIGINAKKARGKMANFIILNKIEDPEDLKLFDIDGYKFEESLSTNNNYQFVRL